MLAQQNPLMDWDNEKDDAWKDAPAVCRGPRALSILDVNAAKLRPILMLTPLDTQGDFIGAQLASRLHHVPTAPIVDPDFELGGLPKASIIRPDNIFTLNKELVARCVGRLNRSGFSRFLGAICTYLGYPDSSVLDTGSQ